MVVPGPADPALAGGDVDAATDPDVETVVDTPHAVVANTNAATNVTIAMGLVMNPSSRV
jgi:hypothetical protein